MGPAEGDGGLAETLVDVGAESIADSGGDTGPGESLSCLPMTPGADHSCGLDGKDDCCAAPLVPGGDFKRLYDGVELKGKGYPATVGAFRLDKYEVTVGRFRNFIAALRRGEGIPKPGSGASRGDPFGWRSDWVAPTADSILSGMKSCLLDGLGASTWTDVPGANERLPINCLAWIEVFAFCVWDNGRLPTNLEYTFAAAGGAWQRFYPWSVPSTNATVDPSYALYAVAVGEPAPLLPVGSRPKGAGLWGHLDLAGSVFEQTRDSGGEAATMLPCVDCASPEPANPTAVHYVRGGAFSSAEQYLRAQESALELGSTRAPYLGGRCAHKW
ncbi:MAG: SUMF1/EgtB/PvdO family nonheme iron enzyme [Myxococcales bacterium]|nr:SUMF1/EgtB/PvdO family nonheme iron enzyme [Myxococcales bacterium]